MHCKTNFTLNIKMLSFKFLNDKIGNPNPSPPQKNKKKQKTTRRFQFINNLYIFYLNKASIVRRI